MRHILALKIKQCSRLVRVMSGKLGQSNNFKLSLKNSWGDIYFRLQYVLQMPNPKWNFLCNTIQKNFDLHRKMGWNNFWLIIVLCNTIFTRFLFTFSNFVSLHGCLFFSCFIKWNWRPLSLNFWRFEVSEDIMMKFKSQALHVIRIKYYWWEWQSYLLHPCPLEHRHFTS